tara:strand:+ start:576 stop:779 length:204 start_codon:yes stop_codon:yes gene_type:complete
MKHAAKRIAHQCYTYRGQRIEAISHLNDTFSHWNIYAGEELCAIDSADTMRECKYIIDNEIEVGELK